MVAPRRLKLTDFQGSEKVVHLLHCSAKGRFRGIGQGSIQDLQDQDLVTQFHRLTRYKPTCLISIFLPSTVPTPRTGLSGIQLSRTPLTTSVRLLSSSTSIPRTTKLLPYPTANVPHQRRSRRRRILFPSSTNLLPSFLPR